MVRSPYFDINGMKKGAWSAEEDQILRDFVLRFGHANWQVLPILAGLKRCGKSCRLRWMNYLKPGLKRGKFTKQEEDLVIKLYAQIGPKWSTMATQLPGRTDNEIKNYWHAHIKKRRQNKNTKEVIIETKTEEDHQSSASQMIHNVVSDQDKLLVGNVEDPAYYVSPLIIHEHDQEQFYYDEYPSSLDAGLRISSCHSAAAEFQANNCFLSSGSEGFYQPLEEEDGFYGVLW